MWVFVIVFVELDFEVVGVIDAMSYVIQLNCVELECRALIL